MWLVLCVFDGCVYVFLCVSKLEFVVQRWFRCGPVMEEAVNDLLPVTVFFLLHICCDCKPVK
jgi:hypothetical protein